MSDVRETDDVPNRVLGASPPDISPLESLLPRSVRTTLAQLRSGHCRLLNTYKAHITNKLEPRQCVAHAIVKAVSMWRDVVLLFVDLGAERLR